MDYNQLVKEIRQHLGSAVDSRFRAGQMISEALSTAKQGTKGKLLARLAKDIEVKQGTIDKWRRVYEYWGDDRVPAYQTWAQYEKFYVTIRARFPEHIVMEAKDRLIAGDDPQDVYDTMRPHYLPPTRITNTPEQEMHRLTNHMRYVVDDIERLDPLTIGLSSDEVREQMLRVLRTLTRKLSELDNYDRRSRTFGGIRVGDPAA